MTKEDKQEQEQEQAKPSHARRLSMSEIVEMALTRRKSSSVSISRAPSGDVTIDVQVATGDGADSLEDAEDKAAAIYSRLAELYPAAEPSDSASVTVARNAKGDTQLEITVRCGSGITSVDEAAARAVELYDAARMRYPMANGLTAKPGTVDLDKTVPAQKGE